MYLNTHSYYSLKYGTLSPQQLVEAAVKKGVTAMALTDINNTSAAFSFIKLCKQKGIKPLLGIEFRRGHRLLYVGIAKNIKGWAGLNAYLSRYSVEALELLDEAPDIQDAYFIYNSLPKSITQFRENEFFGLRPEWINKLYTSSLKAFTHKMVIHSPVTFLDDEGAHVHRLLRCIDKNVLYTQLKMEDCAKPYELFYRQKELLKKYQLYPEIIANTLAIIQTADIDIPSGFNQNRQTFTGEIEDDVALLHKLAVKGCIKRYGAGHKLAQSRVMKELSVIQKMDFTSYFLITWDIIRYAQSVGYHHVGRGSGANSIVAFCMFITDVDPLELDLYFERFINPHRSSPPDFDIDFSWDERDDVTDYIFKRYGKDYTALLATYNTFKGKSIVRELGKVLGLPKSEIDKIAKYPLDAANHHPLAKDIFRYGQKIEGFPNYLSIHAGGVLITEKPIYNFTALQMMPKGFPITHFDMYAAEDIGLHKFDILSQRGLGHIKDAVDLVKYNKGLAVDIHDISLIKNDLKVKEQLKKGDCIGCFYIESPAMRGLLKKLSCDNYIHLVAASSIIRPGVAKSGMMKEYINRFHYPQKFSYLHPTFRKCLGETFGIMVYQEDVMKICHHFAGLDLDESDVLRRIMTGKRKNSDDFFRLKKKYFANCKERGYPPALIDEVWRQIESFSGYSFCKAHSASYAVESFQSLYLKTYHPLEFMVAVINNFGGFYYTEVYFHEARMSGGQIHAPCVNHSLNLTTIIDDNIFVGFGHLQKFERKMSERIVAERNTNGHFLDLQDFVHRVDISSEQLDILIRIGAFRFCGISKYELMWEKNAVFNPEVSFSPVSATLFGEERVERPVLPPLTEGNCDQFFDEIELLGFSLQSPFDLLEGKVTRGVMVDELFKYVGRFVTIIGYYITRKNVRTSTKKLMNFGTWIDRNGAYFDTVHFPRALLKYPFKGKACYEIKGKVVTEFDFPSIEVVKMTKLPFVRDERY